MKGSARLRTPLGLLPVGPVPPSVALPKGRVPVMELDIFSGTNQAVWIVSSVWVSVAILARALEFRGLPCSHALLNHPLFLWKRAEVP